MSLHISSTNCRGCDLRSKPNEDVLGHTNCSEHRPCTGRKYWEPEDCLQCTQTLDRLRYMSNSAVKLRLTEVRTMLTNVQTKLKLENSDRIWKYEPIFNDFFSDFMYLYTDNNDDSEYQQLGDDNEDDAEEMEEDYEDFDNGELFDGHIENAGEQVFPERLSRYPVCNYEYCAFSNENAQCNDPVHNRPAFKCVQRNPSTHRAQINFKRQRSPSPISLPVPPAMSPSDNHSGTLPHLNAALPAVVDVSGVTPLSGPKLPLKLAPYMFCRETYRTYYQFTKEIHTRKGTNHIDIIEMDPTGTFVTTNPYTVEYKPGKTDYFTIVKDLPTSKSPYISPQTAATTFASAFSLQTSNSDIKKSGSEKKYLDSEILNTSGLNQLQDILHELDLACANTATGLSADHILALFAKDNPKEAFDAVNFVNFKDGWTLTNGGYEKFAKDAELNTKNMKEHLITHMPEIKANKQLLAKENETRQAMCHAITTLHFQELLTNKLALMSDEHKTLYGLTPEVSQSLSRMQLSQLKYFISRWMTAKMRVRKDILKENVEDTQLNINFLLQQSLWDADIFPKESFNKLRKKLGVLHLAPLIGLSDSTTNNKNPNGNNNNTNTSNGGSSSSNNGNGYTNNHKKLKTNHQRQRYNNPSYGYGAPPIYNKRGGQQGRPYGKKQYNNANKSATNTPSKRQFNQRGKRGNTPRGKSFRGGEEPK